MEPYVNGYILETMGAVFEVEKIMSVISTKKPIGVSFYGAFPHPETEVETPSLCQEKADLLCKLKKEGIKSYFAFNKI